MTQERPQDLSDDAERALEEQVDEMMEVDRDRIPVPKKINVTMHDDSSEGSKPKARSASAKAKKQTVIVIEQDDEVVTPEISPEETHDELEQAIAEANEQLMQDVPGPPPVVGADAAEPAEVVADKPDPPEEPRETPVTPDDTDEVVRDNEDEPAAISEEQVAPTKPADQPLPDVLDDPALGHAVDDIVAEESDALLRVQDAKNVPAMRAEKPRPRRGFRSFFAGWWHHKWLRRLTLLLPLLILAAAAVYPSTRYFVLNAVGVRSSASVRVTDSSTFQPLKDIEVRIADQTVKTDADGKATLSQLKLGSTQLVIEKRAFATVNKAITIGWGSNPLGDFELTPVGTQYGFVVSDFLSTKPIAKARATAGDASAQADEKGIIRLTLDHADAAKTIEVVLTADGYRDEKVTIGPQTKGDTKLALVPSQKDVFISKRSGKYDVYAVYVDGTKEQKLLAGTGNEQDGISLMTSPDGQSAALVSTRDNVRNADGFLQSTLTLIPVQDEKAEARMVIHSEQINLVGWAGSRLIYVQVAAGTSAANPSRSRLMSYDAKTGENRQLAATNYFNSVMLVGGKVYYAPSGTYQAPGVAVNFFVIHPDGSSKQTVLASETWSVFRTAYDTLVISGAAQDWYEYKLTGSPTKLEGAPGNLKSRVYIDSPDGGHSLWVDTRDGKGVLITYDTKAKTETVLQSKSGITVPFRWLNSSTVLYRVSNDQETADYAVNIGGGAPRKVTDVTNTGTTDRWYYY